MFGLCFLSCLFKNKKGLTTQELIIYLIIIAVLLVFAIIIFSSSGQHGNTIIDNIKNILKFGSKS